MNIRHPVYIPSKGRAETMTTAKLFDREGLPYKVVVEPAQQDFYAAAGYGKKLLVLPENGRGIVYARNWITDYSRARGEERHWQIDDDIVAIYRTYRGWRVRCAGRPAMAACEDFADRFENVAMLSLNSTGYVPVTRGRAIKTVIPPFYLNHRCYTFTLFMNAVPCRWRPPNNEDADMTLQVLARGYCTVLVNAFLMQTPTTMQKVGGQTEAYIAGARLKMVRALERRWPGVVTVGRRHGHAQHMVKFNWSRFTTPLKPRANASVAAKPNEYGLALKQQGAIRDAALAALMKDHE